ncbi:hypothetical protein ATANTOWER_030980 [Ataeniobius toweri]|uniref:Uncharacterized protein n=1 Tax=Ataeniobius toweri TaxID=208326 RepID=A0ABU7A8L6_9TELE|nr:hypothetical protein [Ataeniobius toweri]
MVEPSRAKWRQWERGVCDAVIFLPMRSTELFPHNRAEAIPQSSFSLLKHSLHCACHNWFSGVYIQTGDEPGFDLSAPKAGRGDEPPFVLAYSNSSVVSTGERGGQGDVTKISGYREQIRGMLCLQAAGNSVDDVTVVAITQVNMFCQNSCAVNNKKIYIF